MSPALFGTASAALMLVFILCCVGSAILQILAWSRHIREGARVSFRGLWRPEEYFDEVGERQVHLARTLLIVGGCAYLSFGILVVVANALGAT